MEQPSVLINTFIYQGAVSVSVVLLLYRDDSLDGVYMLNLLEITFL